MSKKTRVNPALSPTSTDRLISPAEKARQLGVTTDTLRRWEAEGRIASIRTAGGQRRYRASEEPSPDCCEHEGDDVDEKNPSAPSSNEVFPAERTALAIPRWQERVEEKKADVEVARLDREHRAILREAAAESAERVQRRERLEREAEWERARRTRGVLESQRLAALIRQGMTFAAAAPIEFQASAKRDLIGYVTSERFPAALTADEASALLRRRIERIIKPWREEEHRSELLKDARTYALVRTVGHDWDFEPAQEARREIERVLGSEVDASWSREDVRARVDELLDEWE